VPIAGYFVPTAIHFVLITIHVVPIVTYFVPIATYFCLLPYTCAYCHAFCVVFIHFSKRRFTFIFVSSCLRNFSLI
jgi:hypothetical protein